jgi:endonuclease/exonuclease/phosphatase family metal-dependent hydrolase
MRLKFLLGACFVLSLLGALVLELGPPRADAGSRGDIRDVSDKIDRGQDARSLRLLTWNIGNGDLESETRAHAEDLSAVAGVIMDNDADAVALQELTGEDQLKLLLTHLKNHYRGYVCSRGKGDRVEAVLVRDRSDGSERGDRSDRSLRFSDVPAGDRFAAAATFRLHQDVPEIVFISAHADAFSASRRRTFAADVVDWARSRTKNELAFVAGDFNFEVSTRNKTNLFTDDAKHDSESYAYLLKYFRDLGLDAGETSINDRRIDYVFGPGETVSLRRAEVLRGVAVGRMDHLPLLVEVAL